MNIKKGMIVKLRKLTRDQWESIADVCSLNRGDVAEIFGSRYTGEAKVSSIMMLDGYRVSPNDHITVQANGCSYWMPRWCLVGQSEEAEKPSAWAARWTQMMEA